MTQNKTTMYLKYAIGEIILVVIGILIALSINNWNEDRIKKKAELNFYQNIKDQLLDDASGISGNKDYNNYYYAQFEYAINIIEINDRTKLDTLALIAINLTNYSDFDRQGNIYETMVNSGDIKLLKNEKIIEGIRRLEDTYIYINRMETIHYDAFVLNVADKLTSMLRYSSGQVEKPDELFSFEFQNLFILANKVMKEKDDIYARGLNEIDGIIKLIETELD